ncbi:hypothetical protein SUGI_0693140 [Cryptomeria japonica]|nr:hypothetical protein SUGI_0693140 [Cryptomeria japonica]
MEFKKCTRDPIPLLFGEWRLASVKEVKDNFQQIKNQNLLCDWSILRLLDGWMDGPRYGWKVEQSYKKGIGEMLLVKTKAFRKGDGALVPEMYSGVYLTEEGRDAALLFSMEDKIAEIIYVIFSIYTKPAEREAQFSCLMSKITQNSGLKAY